LFRKALHSLVWGTSFATLGQSIGEMQFPGPLLLLGLPSSGIFRAFSNHPQTERGDFRRAICRNVGINIMYALLLVCSGTKVDEHLIYRRI